MRFRSKRSILDECLTAMQRGASMEACLARYPRRAAELRPLLTLAQKISQTPPATARPWAQTAAWNAVRLRAAELRAGRRRAKPVTDRWAWTRPVAVALALVLAVIGAGAGTAIAAQDSLPDSPLYRVKLATEDVHVWLTFDETDKAGVLLDQSNERADEMLAMVQKGKPVPSNVLTVLQNRNQRAADIVAARPQETGLRARLLAQAESQESLLIGLWPEVADTARLDYTEAVAGLHNTRLQGGEALVGISPDDLSGGVLSISGQAELVGAGVWRVGGVELKVDERTIGSAQLQSGATAKFTVARSSKGRLQALSLSTVQTDTGPTGAIVGNVEEITDEGIRIGGQFIRLSPDTLEFLKPKAGERVEITVKNDASGVSAASVRRAPATANSEAPKVTFEGTIEDVSSPNEWTIGGLDFEVTANALVADAGNLQAGARAWVEASTKGGKLVAQRVTVLASDKPSDNVFLIGVFQGYDHKEDVWIVSGIAVDPPETGTDPPQGSTVAIDARRVNRDLVPTQVIQTQTPEQSQLVRFDGAISTIEGSVWTGTFGQVRAASAGTKVYPVGAHPSAGARVIGWAEPGRDGLLQAVYVRILDTLPVAAVPVPEPAPTQ